MKSKILYLTMLALTVFIVASCEKETKDKTWITYYPELVLEGDATLVVDKGSVFTDPGYSATLNGEDVTEQVIVTSNVNTSTSGVYSVYYEITNSDGFSSSASRTVIVLDLSDPVEGFYDTDPELCYREQADGTTDNAYYATSWEILVINNGDGTYSIDDLLGGYYCYGRNYGSTYAMESVVTIADDGTLGLVDSYVAGWGDSAESLDGTYDADTQTFSWSVEYTSTPYYFHVVMTKRQ